MSLIAEFTIETPILQDALDAVPDMVLRTETIDALADDPLRSMIWAWGDDFNRFERHLNSERTIEGYNRITEIDDRRLYRLTFTERAEELVTYPTIVAHDSVLLDTTGTHEGLRIRARFPEYDALAAYREVCRERDVPFHLHSLYSEDEIAGDGGTYNPHGVTDAQREALVTALELGYFAVPRETTLEEIADELGVTVQAVSTRMRRGQETLVRNALAR